jgi:hypothetical protein
VQHESTGSDEQRVMHIRKGDHIFRRQLQDENEKHPDDAVNGPEGSAAEDSNDGDDSAASEEDSADGALVPSHFPVEFQDGVLCLKHSLNNVLYAYAGGAKIATTEQFGQAAADLNAHLGQVENVPPERFGDRSGYMIDVASQFLTTHLPRCRIQHSESIEVGDGEDILSACLSRVLFHTRPSPLYRSSLDIRGPLKYKVFMVKKIGQGVFHTRHFIFLCLCV